MATKLYCYVDETGQDTQGNLFIVVALVVEEERIELEKFLEQVEQKSGKGKRKWINTRLKEKEKYLAYALTPDKFKEKIFYCIQHNTKAYEEQTVITIEQSIRNYISTQKITNYKAIIVIDGLPKQAEKRVGAALRRARIKTRKVRGERDQSNALLRLTDMVAGCVREAAEGEVTYTKLTKKLEKEHILNEL